VRHGAKLKRCSSDGCTSHAQKGGVCKRHVLNRPYSCPLTYIPPFHSPRHHVRKQAGGETVKMPSQVIEIGIAMDAISLTVAR
jgi:hypothetical protein